MKLNSFNYSYKLLAVALCTAFFGYQKTETGAMQNTMHPAFLLTIIQKIEQGQNVIFTKYGDGEYFCMEGRTDANCDGDRYHTWLGDALKNALISLCRKPNTYIAKWWESFAYDYCDDLARKNGVTIPWTWYHLIMNGDEFLSQDYMYRFVLSIQKSKRKKIVVCNQLNARLKRLFHADVCVEIPKQSWSFEYPIWKDAVEKHLEKNCIVLISGGMCSKVLINDITDKHDITCLDIGSAFDLLARKENTRGRQHTYEHEVWYYRNLLPQYWD